VWYNEKSARAGGTRAATKSWVCQGFFEKFFYAAGPRARP